MSELEVQEVCRNTQKVWNALSDAIAGISVQELCHQLALTFEEVMTAVRWLSRDYNIGMANRDGNLILIGA